MAVTFNGLNVNLMLIFQVINTLGLLVFLYLSFRLVRYLWVKTRKPAVESAKNAPDPLDEESRLKIKSL